MEDVEYIVRRDADMRVWAKRKAAARRFERRLRNMLLRVLVLATITIFIVFFGAIGAIHSTLATGVSVVLTMTGSFILGKYVEATKRK